MFYFISPVESIDLDFFSWLRKIEIISYYDKSKLVNVGVEKRLAKKSYSCGRDEQDWVEKQIE